MFHSAFHLGSSETIENVFQSTCQKSKTNLSADFLIIIVIFRYPFHGQEHTGLFAKIRRGQFTLPDSISSRAKCLIRCLLRKDPTQRLTTEDVLIHPWVTLSTPTSASCHASSSRESRRVSSSNMTHPVPKKPIPIRVNFTFAIYKGSFVKYFFNR